jgi:hypothetical protein
MNSLIGHTQEASFSVGVMVVCIHGKVTAGVLAALGGLVAYRLYKRFSRQAKANTYETLDLLHQYLCFHFGQPEDVLLHKFGPVDALYFARDCARECLASAPVSSDVCPCLCLCLYAWPHERPDCRAVLKVRSPDVWGQNPVPSRALDIGCAVGRSSFELARGVKEVVGIDFSASFVRACNDLKVSSLDVCCDRPDPPTLSSPGTHRPKALWSTVFKPKAD